MNDVIRYSRASNQTVYRSESPLTDDEIAKYAPSVFAESKHESRGDRYAFISTREVLAGLRYEGFQPYEVRQTRVRNEDKRGFTKHLLRFRHPFILREHGKEVPEIILLNSHDGTSAYRLMSGLFRMVCSNGLIAGDVQNDIKVRHSGKVVDNVIEGAFRVIDDIKAVEGQVDEMKRLKLTSNESDLLAQAAVTARWGSEEAAPVQPVRLLAPRRFEDRSDDLWTRFNVLQENIVKGGVEGRTATNRSTHTRAVQGVTENVRINRALWQLADAFAGLKTGRIDPHQLQESLHLDEVVE